MPESKHPCAARSFEMPEGVLTRELPEAAVAVPEPCRGPSTPRTDSPANQPAALRM